MTDVEIVRARVEAVLDRGHWHGQQVPADAARAEIRAALDEPLPAQEQAS